MAVKEYFTKKRIKNISLAGLMSVVVAGVFLVYFVFIGIPRTAARNLYNEAVLEIQAGDISEGLELLHEAYDTWPETYIAEEIDKVETIN